MTEILTNISFGAGLLIWVALIVAFCILIYIAFYYFIRGSLKEKHKSIADFFFRFSASLLAFILSISFANQRINYSRLQSSIEEEAAKLVDIHLDLKLFDTEASKLVQIKVRTYIVLIADNGWADFDEDPFASEPILLFREIYQDINYLETNTPFQERLKQKLINNTGEALNALQSKIYSSGFDSKHLISTSIFGLIILMFLFAVHPPDALTIGFLSVYITFIAVVLYFILMMGSPLKGPLQLEPGPFILLKETIEVQYSQ